MGRVSRSSRVEEFWEYGSENLRYILEQWDV
jgi:hypothetical protein